jgi:hypothetical protein
MCSLHSSHLHSRHASPAQAHALIDDHIALFAGCADKAASGREQSKAANKCCKTEELGVSLSEESCTTRAVTSPLGYHQKMAAPKRLQSKLGSAGSKALACTSVTK